jgi:hypothetical protein
MSATVRVMVTSISSIRATLWCEELYGVETELLEKPAARRRDQERNEILTIGQNRSIDILLIA